MSKIINHYFNERLDFINFMPTICLNEIVFSFLDFVSEFDKSLSSTVYRTFISDSISTEDAYSIIGPYYDVFLEIVKNKPIVNNEILKFYVSAVFANGQVSIDKKKIDKVLLAYYAIKELQKRNEVTINRIWNYMVTKKEASLACHKSDLLDKEKFNKSIDCYFKEIQMVVLEMIENVPIKINSKIKGLYYYEVIHSYVPFPNYSIRIALKEEASKLTFEKHNINNDEIYRFSMWSSLIEDLFEDGLPFYNTCRLALQKFICDKISVDEVGITIGGHSVKMPLH